jgi:hypothetical protein
MKKTKTKILKKSKKPAALLARDRDGLLRLGPDRPETNTRN